MNNDRYKILQEDPVDFIELAFNETLWSKQQDIVDAVRDHPYTTVKSCFDSGKSFIAARIALHFLYTHVNSKVITTAPTAAQVQDILWREIRTAKDKSRLPLGGKVNLTSIDLGTDWFAVGMSTNKPTNFQGRHAVYILLIIDEAAGVEEEIFTASEGLLSSEHARCLYIGNPTNIEGTFYKSFTLPNFAKFTISAFDTPNFTHFGITLDDIHQNTWEQKITGPLPAPYLVTPKWVADKLVRWGEDSPMFQAMVLGEFPTQGDDTLIPLHKIEAAGRTTLSVDPADPEHIGVDIARFGVDRTEFCYRKGPKVIDWQTFTHMDTLQSSGHLRHFMGLHPAASVSIDEVGVGAGVLDNVKTNEPFKSVTGINVGLPAHDDAMFFNLRAEYYWHLRELFVNGEIDLSAVSPMILEDLKGQLSNIKFKYTGKNQIQIEPKEEMKKRGLSSPDKADALALAFGNVQKKPSVLEFMSTFKGA